MWRDENKEEKKGKIVNSDHVGFLIQEFSPHNINFHVGLMKLEDFEKQNREARSGKYQDFDRETETSRRRRSLYYERKRERGIQGVKW